MGETKHTLFACVTCDPRGETHSHDALGNQVYKCMKEAVAADNELRNQLNVEPVKCMGGCDHSCTVSFAAPGKITWVFNQQGPDTISDVLDTARLYIARVNGQMLREERSPALQCNVFCKIPAVK